MPFESCSAQLNSAQLSPAQLSSAQLSSAQLRSAQLSSAQLSSARLSSAQLSSAQLSSAQLSSAQTRRDGHRLHLASQSVDQFASVWACSTFHKALIHPIKRTSSSCYYRTSQKYRNVILRSQNGRLKFANLPNVILMLNVRHCLGVTRRGLTSVSLANPS